VVVITTIVKDPSDPDAAKYREVYLHNLRLLADHRARIAIGTDMRGSVPEEVLYISSLGVFDNRTLLNVLTRATAKAIFPTRKIGELRDGYAASFLALDGNPLDSLENIKRISVRVKEGIVIEVRPSPVGDLDSGSGVGKPDNSTKNQN
jgi:imidazolonepropionase-like amidohydrolase